MAVQFQIGAFQFITWEGGAPPDFRGEKNQLFQRPGQAGSGYHFLGQQGTPFTAKCTAHFATMTAAIANQQAAQTLRAAGEVDVIYAYQNYTAYGQKFKVLDVKTDELKTCVHLSGPGYNYSAGTKLVLSITMVAA